MTFAVVGPDGAGKTTFLEGYDPIHAIPWSRKFSEWRRHRVLIEILMGVERTVRSWVARLQHRVMDRCYIDAEAYSIFWSEETGHKICWAVCKLFNVFNFKPKEIVFMMVDPNKAKPKRAYSPQDIKRLRGIYLRLLSRDFHIQDYRPYDLGMITFWVKN